LLRQATRDASALDALRRFWGGGRSRPHIGRGAEDSVLLDRLAAATTRGPLAARLEPVSFITDTARPAAPKRTPLQAETKAFLAWLGKNKAVRDRIKAETDRTLLYAGNFFKPVWQELDELRKRQTGAARLQLLPDVLERIEGPDGSGTLKQHVDRLTGSVPWREDGFTIWRALSGIFASNAVGKVYFYVGSDIRRDTKVLAATEIWVLGRNPNLDPGTKEIVAWLQKCVQEKRSDIDFGFMPGD